MLDVVPFVTLGIVAAMWLCVISVAKPRLLLYTLIALLPTQFLFIPVSDFFISPADVLTGAATLGLVVRLTSLRRHSWRALYAHRFLVLMLASYVIGFVLLGVFSRTLVRVPIAIVISVLACELLQTRQHLTRAAVALVIAGAVDAGYGLFWIARGAPLHPSRFSGMSDVNFSAMLIVTSAAVALALVARTRRLFDFIRPAALSGVALATLSQMGVLALLSAWVTVLRRFISGRNKAHIIAAVTLLVIVAVIASPVRERLLSRNVREVQADGVERNSSDIRWMILQTAWDGFKTSPILGLGYFKFVEFSNTQPEIQASTAGQGYPTHNTYLEVLVEGGLITFGLFVLHWLQYLKAFPRAVRTAARDRDPLTAACLVGFPVMIVCAALANVMYVYSFWAVCGVALACLNLLKREPSWQREPT